MSSWFASGHHNQDGVVWSVLGEDIRMMCSISNMGNRRVTAVHYGKFRGTMRTFIIVAKISTFVDILGLFDPGREEPSGNTN